MSRGSIHTLGAGARRSLALLWTAMLLATFLVPYSALTAPARVVAADNSQACGIVPLDVEFILDNSGSMSSNSSGGKTRAQWAQTAISGMIDQLDANGGIGTGPAASTGGRHRVGLTKYAGTTASVLSPLGANDAAGTKAKVPSTGSGNTPFKTGMAAGAGDLAANKRTTDFGLAVRHIIIFLSDGRPNPDGPVNGSYASDNDSQRPTAANVASFQAPADEVFSIAIGAGGRGASAVDLGLMQLLAKPGDGSHYANIVDAADLPAAFDSIFQDIACKATPTLSTQVSSPSADFGAKVSDTATLVGDGSHAVTGSVAFSLCGPTASAADCKTGGAAVGTVTVSGGKATSPDYTVGTTAAATGYYCFRADYTPDTAGAAYYFPTSHTNSTTECFYVAPATIKLAKTADAATVSPGGQVGYTVTVSNTGANTALGVSVTDNLPTNAGLSWTLGTADAGWSLSGSALTFSGSLAAGESASAHVTSPTTSATCGTISNSASATSTSDGTASAGPVTIFVACPALSLEKSAAPATYSAAGQSIGYTYTLTNSGNVTLSAPYAVSDDRIASVSCPSSPATLAPGASVTCTATYTTTQSDVDNGKVTNHATATAKHGADTVTSNEAQATVTADQNAKLSLAKGVSLTDGSGYQASLTTDAGTTVYYRIVVTNTGNVTLSGLTLTDNTFDLTSCARPSTLAVGASFTCDYSDTAAVGSKVNTATADSDQTQPVSDSATVTVEAKDGLGLVKSAAPGTYDEAGDVIDYTYTLKNTGNVALYAPYAVSDDKIADGEVTCPSSPASLAPGETVTCTASYTITQADVDAGEVINTAIATARDSKDGTVTSNEAKATVTADQSAKLSLEKSADPGTFSAVGDVIDYTYTLKNTGNVTLYAPYAVSDDRIASVTCPSSPASLAPGETVECTASYTITEADVDAQSVTNTAFATANDGEIKSNDDQATVDLERNSGIHIVKAASVPVLPAGGGKVTYTYTVTNTGNVPLSDVTVTDDKCAPVEYVSGDISDASSDGPSGNGLLDLNETWIFRCVATLTATTTNVATATGHDGDTTVQDTDTKTVVVGKVSPNETPRLTLPPTSTLDTDTPGGQSPTGLLLLLVAVAGIMLAAGIVVPGPARARRRARRG